MSKSALAPEPVDIGSIEDLRSAVAQVRKTAGPLLVRVGDDTALLAPAPDLASSEARAVTDAKDDDFLSAAGSWRGHLDPEEFKRQIKAGRSSARAALRFGSAES